MPERILTDDEVESFESIWLECPDAETAEDVHSIIRWGRHWQKWARETTPFVEEAEAKVAEAKLEMVGLRGECKRLGGIIDNYGQCLKAEQAEAQAQRERAEKAEATLEARTTRQRERRLAARLALMACEEMAPCLTM